MSNFGKTLVTIILIVVFIFVFGLLTAADVSKTFLGLLALGLFFGIRAMWKKPKEPEASSDIKLDKSETIEKDNTSTNK